MFLIEIYTTLVAMAVNTDYRCMMTRSQISAAQIHIPIPNRKSFKMYESLNFLQKKWLSNAKSRTRDTQQAKFEQIGLPKIP